MFKIILTTQLVMGLLLTLNAQSTTRQVDNIEVSSSTAKFLGTSRPVKDLVKKSSTTKEKKSATKRAKRVPDNFKNRKPGGKSVHAELEHQGPDPIRQTSFDIKPANGKSGNLNIEPLVNVKGISSGASPNDPTGDVSDMHYMQAINATDVAVFDLDGNLVEQFAMNTLWAEFNGVSVGDPIILYDERAEKWIVTEFSDPANLFIAISATKDPLGSYHAYSFSTPEFPDYPKFGITPEALVVSTNEDGPGVLHQYFLDIQALYAGQEDVRMIRVEVEGNDNTEAAFYLTTPVDWNGNNMPFDSRPMTMTINDSSWAGGPAQDQVEIYTFNLDFATPNNTTVEQTAIITTPFDSYPCSSSGGQFGCVPQLNGEGLDAIPEVIMNIPHLRNFGTHESIVFNFITDVTDGENLSGIRWVELRRTASTAWELYQEGTFSPDDDLNRFMGSIAMDNQGNIGLAYNVTSEDSFVGVRFTGRYAGDPLGQMTVPEVTLVEGGSIINDDGRFGDYSQMSVNPAGDTFWFITEYAGEQEVDTRIAAFQLEQAAFDLSGQAILNPTTSANLGANEVVSVNFVNRGQNALTDYEVGFLLNNNLVQSVTIPESLAAGANFDYQFSTPIDLSAIGDYEITAYISHPSDENDFNDTIKTVVSKLPALDGSITSTATMMSCKEEVPATITLTNLGGETITTATIDVAVNGANAIGINYTGSIAYNESAVINYTITENLQEGENTVAFVLRNINNSTDNVAANNITRTNFTLTAPGEFITLIFNTDEYPEETTWLIVDADTDEEILAGSFAEAQAESRIVQDICLPTDACYFIIVEDSENDGICCDFGEGDFSVLDANGQVLIFNDGDFGSETMEEFCPRENDCSLNATVTTENATTDISNDGSIMITPTGGIAPYEYSIDGGETFQESNIFSNLPAGEYAILVSDDDGCELILTVVIELATGIYSINGQEVEVNIMPNPTQGVFKISITNLEINTPLLDFSIYDITGKLIQQRTIGRYNQNYVGTLSLYDYPNGNYFLRIRQEGVNIMERIVKID